MAFRWVNLEDLRNEGFFDMVAQEGTRALRLEIHEDGENPIKLVDIGSGEQRGEYDRVEDCPINCP